MTYIWRILETLFYVAFAAYGVVVAVTLVWTITGHCCGSPMLGTAWDSCLPYGDTEWPTRIIMHGHCDPDTWKRVP